MAQTPARQVKPYEVRAAAFISELNKAADEYRSALNDFEATRQRFEVAKETLGVIQRRAPDVLPRNDWLQWQYSHPELWAMGTEIGDAILTALRSHAVDEGVKSLESNGVVAWDPSMTTAQLVEALDGFGFQFRTAAPRREVHAALLRLKGISKIGDGRYSHGEAQEIYKLMTDSWLGDNASSDAERK